MGVVMIIVYCIIVVDSEFVVSFGYKFRLVYVFVRVLRVVYYRWSYGVKGGIRVLIVYDLEIGRFIMFGSRFMLVFR